VINMSCLRIMYKLPFIRHNLLCSLTAHARRQVHAGAILFKMKNVSDESDNLKQQQPMNEYYSRFTSEQFNVNKTDDDDVYEIVPQSAEEGDDELDIFSTVGLELGKTGVIEPEEICRFVDSIRCTDIVCVGDTIGTGHTLIIATALSAKHAYAVMAKLRTLYNRRCTLAGLPMKLQAQYSTRGCEWYTLDLGNAIMHVMTDTLRRKYDLEMLWLCGDDASDVIRAATATAFDREEEAELDKQQRMLDEWLASLNKRPISS